jgi:hypothetical protein
MKKKLKRKRLIMQKMINQIIRILQMQELQVFLMKPKKNFKRKKKEKWQNYIM